MRSSGWRSRRCVLESPLYPESELDVVYEVNSKEKRCVILLRCDSVAESYDIREKKTAARPQSDVVRSLFAGLGESTVNGPYGKVNSKLGIACLFLEAWGLCQTGELRIVHIVAIFGWRREIGENRAEFEWEYSSIKGRKK